MGDPISPSTTSSYQHSDPPCTDIVTDCAETDDGLASYDVYTAHIITRRRKKVLLGLLIFVFLAAAGTAATSRTAVILNKIDPRNELDERVEDVVSISIVEASHTSATIFKEGGESSSRSRGVGNGAAAATATPTAFTVRNGDRVFLHISDTHADPYYDYQYYWESAKKISRDPRLFSKDQPAELCGEHSETYQSIVKHWNITSNPGKTCQCGHFGANPPFSVIASLADDIAKHDPEFVVWGGDFTSHNEPGTNTDDDCRTAKNVAKATVSILNVRYGIGSIKKKKPIQHLWVFGNNDVLPKYEPLTQDWLEEFGQHLVKEDWLTPEEYKTTWLLGGFYRRNLGQGLCVINLNSNSWTVHQINEEHHEAQIKWLEEEAFMRGIDGDDCNEFLINAHIPLGWLDSGRGHHKWTNLEDAVAHEYCDEYRAVIDVHHKHIIAELYGHINKADVRLMGKGAGGNNNKGDEESTDEGKDPVSVATEGDPLGDIDENIGDDATIVAFTVAGISRRANNDPQFQRITLEPQDMLKKHGIKDIEVYSMKGDDCFENAFTFAYSFRDLFKPDFDDGINVETVLSFVENDELQRKRIEKHMALTSMPYTSKSLKDSRFIDAVRSDKTGCELGPPHIDN
jgi:hypothetical protein